MSGKPGRDRCVSSINTGCWDLIDNIKEFLQLTKETTDGGKRGGLF
jgi:hypothetical protein